MRSHISTDEGLNGYRKDFEIKEYKVRKRFEKVAQQVILPFFLIKDRKAWRKVSYEMDILSRIQWQDISLENIYNLSLAEQRTHDDEFIAQLSNDVKKVIEEKRIASKDAGGIVVDNIFMSQQLSDVIPNPWEAYRFSEDILNKLISIHGEALVSQNFSFVIEESKRQISEQRDVLAGVIFNKLLEDGTIRFMVVSDDLGYKLPKKIKAPANAEYLRRPDGSPMQLSLFEYVAKESFTHQLEKPVAYFLDDQERLFFWYRNDAKKDYGIQAWKKDKIYPDFIFTVTDKKEKDKVKKVYIVETKGVMLAGNPDTKYKESVFQLCNRLAKKVAPNTLNLVMKDKEIEYEVIYGQEWQRRLRELFA